MLSKMAMALLANTENTLTLDVFATTNCTGASQAQQYPVGSCLIPEDGSGLSAIVKCQADGVQITLYNQTTTCEGANVVTNYQFERCYPDSNIGVKFVSCT